MPVKHAPSLPFGLPLETVPAEQTSGTPDAPPGLARAVDAPTTAEREAGAQRRHDADLVVRELVRVALQRTGPSTIFRRLGVSRALVRGWADDGLALTLRDLLSCPRSFARDVLESALLVVLEDVPSTVDDIERLATRLLLVSSDLLRAVSGPMTQPDHLRRRVVLAVVDRIEDLCRQIRRAVNVPPAPPSGRNGPPSSRPSSPTPSNP